MKKKNSGKKKTRNLPAKALTAKQATQVKAGGKKKTGGGQEVYLQYNLDEAFITKVDTGNTKN